MKTQPTTTKSKTSRKLKSQEVSLDQELLENSIETSDYSFNKFIESEFGITFIVMLFLSVLLLAVNSKF
jgi:hypothetical protein